MSERDRVSRIVRAGLSVVEAAAIAGVCRSTAYQMVSSLGLVRAPRIPSAARLAALRLIASSRLSMLEIAVQAGISKTSVLRIRDQAARRGARQEGQQFRQTRRAYCCPGCGARVRIAPCVACMAREAECRSGE